MGVPSLRSLNEVRSLLGKLWGYEGFVDSPLEDDDFEFVLVRNSNSASWTNLTFSSEPRHLQIRSFRRIHFEDGGCEIYSGFTTLNEKGSVRIYISKNAPHGPNNSILAEMEDLVPLFRKSLHLSGIKGDASGHEMFAWESNL